MPHRLTRTLVALCISLGCAGTLDASGQTPEEEVAAVVQRLFDGMRAGDSTMVRSVFHADARMLTMAERDGAPVLREGRVDGFVEAVGTPHDRVWDERISDLEIRVDGPMASAWMDYAFYHGGAFSHCGVNAMQLFRSPEGWQIVSLADTRRQEGCDE